MGSKHDAPNGSRTGRVKNLVGRSKQFLSSVEAWCLFYTQWVWAVSQALTDDVMAALFPKRMRAAERAQVDTIISVVVVAVVAIVGILIYSEVNDAITVTGDLSSSKQNLTSGFGDAMELVPIVLIVLVAALVIGVVARFRGGNGGE